MATATVSGCVSHTTLPGVSEGARLSLVSGRDLCDKAKDAAQDYKQAAETGDYTGMIKVDSVVDELLPYTVDDPPKNGLPEFKVICRTAAEALSHKWAAYQRYHIVRIAGAYNAVSDGQVVPVAEPVDEGPRISGVLEKYIACRDSVPMPVPIRFLTLPLHLKPIACQDFHLCRHQG